MQIMVCDVSFELGKHFIKKKGTQKKIKKFVAVQQPFPKNYADGNKQKQETKM